MSVTEKKKRIKRGGIALSGLKRPKKETIGSGIFSHLTLREERKFLHERRIGGDGAEESGVKNSQSNLFLPIIWSLGTQGGEIRAGRPGEGGEGVEQNKT